MGAEMDKQEIDVLLAAVGSVFWLSAENASPEKKFILEKAGKDDPYGSSWVFEAGRIVERLRQLLTDDDAPKIAPIEEFPDMDVVQAVQQSKDKQFTMYSEVLPWLQKAFRYGYYQALIDQQGKQH